MILMTFWVKCNKPTEVHVALKQLPDLCLKYTSKSIITIQTFRKKDVLQKHTWRFKWIGYFHEAVI